jgi:periplasmic divalent cation tolerance protein
LLDEQLIACANIMPTMQTLYVWQGQRNVTQECGVLFKTDAALLQRAAERLEQIQPYDQPAVIGWRADATVPSTATWLGALVEQPT